MLLAKPLNTILTLLSGSGGHQNLKLSGDSQEVK